MTSPWPTPPDDGHAMCCLCFRVLPLADLHRDADGSYWDVCKACHAEEATHAAG